ncbi:hypothetical protein [Prosthecomicrobium hirschii]|uniref:hypothetical protein n=1 Tax=Prosthecodimorpha hirschii TaxID=665126 RepID=UPI00221E97F3|nr:hypothetical protein [Prosthecomicrobium hirschii]MCW1839792.1 hypothetical protein [Prosthecomicrobium hirschii]
MAATARPLRDPTASFAQTALVPFSTAPFPYRGDVPGQGKPFLDVVQDGRAGHTSPRGGVYFEDQTYSDSNVLLSIPRGYDPGKPTLIVLYLHGNEAKLERDVRDRQRVPRQVAESGLNAVLVAPQFAVNALDSSAGMFWQPGHFAKFLQEAAAELARLRGDPPLAETLAKAPVLIVAYSGGYLPAIYAMSVGDAAERIQGVVLLDALFGEEDRYAEWLPKRGRAFFFSAYSSGSESNNTRLMNAAEARRVPFEIGIPARFEPGRVSFLYGGRNANHRDFVTRAWVSDPLQSVLSRIPGFSLDRRPPGIGNTIAGIGPDRDPGDGAGEAEAAPTISAQPRPKPTRVSAAGATGPAATANDGIPPGLGDSGPGPGGPGSLATAQPPGPPLTTSRPAPPPPPPVPTVAAAGAGPGKPPSPLGSPSVPAGGKAPGGLDAAAAGGLPPGDKGGARVVGRPFPAVPLLPAAAPAPVNNGVWAPTMTTDDFDKFRSGFGNDSASSTTRPGPTGAAGAKPKPAQP